MTGIDLFKALGGVKEEYIAEADGSRKLPHVKNVTLQWCAALAIGGKVVLPVRITAETQPVSDVKVFTDEEKIGQIMPLLLLKNAAETSDDPNAYGGSANIFTLEYANGETSTITVYGNLFYKKDDGPWCDIPYEQAEKLEELVRSLGSDE